MQYKQPISMAHVIGSFAKGLGIVAVFLLSAALSFMFFATITPAGKPWFPYAAMGLTEGGFVIWLAVFLMMKHDPFGKSVALITMIACAIASFIVAGTELDILFNSATGVINNASVYGTVAIVLEVMFALHLIMAIVDVLHGYFARPGNSFFSASPGNLIPTNGNLIPTNSYSLEELRSAQERLSGQIAAIESGETDSPLEYHPVMLSQVGTVAKEGVSSLIKRGKDAIESGKKVGRVRGQTNETTGANTPTNVSE